MAGSQGATGETRRKLWEEVKGLRENQERLWQEVRELRVNQTKLWEKHGEAMGRG
jgi:hypothetical protein